MSKMRQVPQSVYSFLSAATVARTADLMLHDLRSHPEHRLLHPGDRFGDYLTWLWREDKQTETAMVLASLIAELRDHHPEADPTCTLEELLAGVRLAIYPLTDGETKALVDLAREKVPQYYGGNLDQV